MRKLIFIPAILLILCGLGAAKEPKMKLTSTAFEYGKPIPAKYTADGANVSPPLKIENIPDGAKSFVLVVDDPDAPRGVWDHWIVYDIAVTNEIAEDSVPGTQGLNSRKNFDYGGPCPPSGTHRYFFKLYALDATLDLPEGKTKAEVEAAMKGHVIAQAELMGTYERKK